MRLHVKLKWFIEELFVKYAFIFTYLHQLLAIFFKLLSLTFNIAEL